MGCAAPWTSPPADCELRRVTTQHQRADELAGVTSAISGRAVRRRRFRAASHAFSYSLFMLGLGYWTKLPAAEQGRWFGVERARAVSLRRDDYLKGSEGSPSEQAVWRQGGSSWVVMPNPRGGYCSRQCALSGVLLQPGKLLLLLAGRGKPATCWPRSNAPGTSVTTTCWDLAALAHDKDFQRSPPSWGWPCVTARRVRPPAEEALDPYRESSVSGEAKLFDAHPGPRAADPVAQGAGGPAGPLALDDHEGAARDLLAGPAPFLSKRTPIFYPPGEPLMELLNQPSLPLSSTRGPRQLLLRLLGRLEHGQLLLRGWRRASQLGARARTCTPSWWCWIRPSIAACCWGAASPPEKPGWRGSGPARIRWPWCGCWPGTWRCSTPWSGASAGSASRSTRCATGSIAIPSTGRVQHRRPLRSRQHPLSGLSRQPHAVFERRLLRVPMPVWRRAAAKLRATSASGWSSGLDHLLEIGTGWVASPSMPPVTTAAGSPPLPSPGPARLCQGVDRAGGGWGSHSLAAGGLPQAGGGL